MTNNQSNQSNSVQQSTGQTQSVFKSEIRQFKGKELVKQGTRLDKDGNEVQWKLFTLLTESGTQYPYKFKSFQKLSDKGLQVNQLEEGIFYKFVYTEEKYTNEYGEQTSRNVKVIEPVTAQQVNDYMTTAKNNAQLILNSNNNTNQTNRSGVGNLSEGVGSGNSSTLSEITLQNFLDKLSSHPNLKPRTPDFFSYEEKVRFGQAINLTFQLMTSHQGFKVSDYNYDSLKELLFKTVYPCINKFWLEFEARKKSLLQSNEQIQDNLNKDKVSETEDVNFNTTTNNDCAKHLHPDVPIEQINPVKGKFEYNSSLNKVQ